MEVKALHQLFHIFFLYRKPVASMIGYGKSEKMFLCATCEELRTALTECAQSRRDTKQLQDQKGVYINMIGRGRRPYQMNKETAMRSPEKGWKHLRQKACVGNMAGCRLERGLNGAVERESWRLKKAGRGKYNEGEERKTPQVGQFLVSTAIKFTPWRKPETFVSLEEQYFEYNLLF